MNEVITKWNKWFSAEIQNNDTQVDWCFQYMLKQRFPLHPNDHPSDIFRYFAEENSVAALELLKSMKQAWSQKKKRLRASKKSRKGYSFVMSNDVKFKLKQLAENKGEHINDVLEAMILENDQFRLGLKENWDSKVQNLNEQRTRQLDQIKSQINRAKIAEKRFAAIIQLQKDAISKIAYQKHKMDLLLTKLDAKTEEIKLEEQDFHTIQESTNQYLIQLEDEIKSETKHLKPKVQPKRIFDTIK